MPKIIVNSTHNKNIDLSNAKSSGGQTGSVRVALDSDYYQYKFSITESGLLRQAKAFLLDKENFGELLASRIAQKYDAATFNSSRVPNVYFVADAQTIIMNANISIDEKFQLIKHKIEQTKDHTLAKSHSFSELINTFVHLFKTYCASITSIFTSADESPIQNADIIHKNQNMKSVLSHLVHEHDTLPIIQEQQKLQHIGKEEDDDGESEGELPHL